MLSFKEIKQRLATRKDTEHRQAILRVIIVGIAACSVWYIFGRSNTPRSDSVAMLLEVAKLFVISSVAIIVHIILYPQPNAIRRYLSMILDVLGPTLYLIWGERHGALFLFVFPFITIGNGFRFGERSLIASSVLSTLGLGITYILSDYWKQLPF